MVTFIALGAAAEEEEEARKAAFAANRAAHYNMAAALRGHVSFEEEDEDAEGQGEACSKDAADDDEITDDADDPEGLSRKEKFAQKRKVPRLSYTAPIVYLLPICRARKSLRRSARCRTYLIPISVYLYVLSPSAVICLALLPVLAYLRRHCRLFLGVCAQKARNKCARKVLKRADAVDTGGVRKH
jgi:hypothetical protein